MIKLRRPLLVQPVDVRQIVHRLLGQILARAHAAAGQAQAPDPVHALQRQQIVGRLGSSSLSSLAMACVSSTSRARLRSSSTMSSSNSSISSSS